MTLEIHFLVWDRHANVVGLNRLMGSLLALYSLKSGLHKTMPQY